MELSVAKLGVHRGALAAAHVAQWVIATDDLGHVPTTVEYSEYWAIDERTGWRHRANVAAVLGDEWQAAVEALVREVDSHSKRAVMGLPVRVAV